MNRRLDLFVYLDENLVRNVSSIMLNGYIDICKITRIKDKTLAGHIKFLKRSNSANEFRYSKEETDGYKKKNNNNGNRCEDVDEKNACIEDREYDRQSEEFTRINTLFISHFEMVNALNGFGGLRNINEKHIINNDVSCGELIELDGRMSGLSLISYIDTLINIITCYGDTYLNSLISKENNLGLLNFTIIYNLLKSVKDSLVSNGTQDYIFMVGNVSVILLINEKNFLRNNAHIYDLLNCECKILGKVMKVNNEGNSTSLMRKSCRSVYYEKLLNSIRPYLNMLEDNGIILPEQCGLNIEGPSLNVLPISICI